MVKWMRDVVKYSAKLILIMYFNTILCLLLVTHVTNGAQFMPPNGNLLKLLVKNLTGEVVVSTNTTLYTLSAGLSLQESVRYGGQFRMLAQSDVGHFMWCDSINCSLTAPSTSITFPSNIRDPTFADVFLESDTTVVSATIIPQSDQNLIYVLKSEVHENSRILLTISSITLNTSTFILTGFHDEDLYRGFRRRDIISTIKSNDYFYYIINRVQSEDELTVRLIRICSNDTGIIEQDVFRLTRTFNSYYELQLQCGDGNQATSATYYNGAGGAHIIISFIGQTCAYRESVISSLITNKFTQCSQGVGLAGLSIIERQRPCITSDGEQFVSLSRCKCNACSSVKCITFLVATFQQGYYSHSKLVASLQLAALLLQYLLQSAHNLVKVVRKLHDGTYL